MRVTAAAHDEQGFRVVLAARSSSDRLNLHSHLFAGKVGPVREHEDKEGGGADVCGPPASRLEHCHRQLPAPLWAAPAAASAAWPVTLPVCDRAVATARHCAYHPVLVGKSVAAQPPKLWCRASIVGRHVLMRQRHGTCVQQAARAWCMNSASGWGMVPELSKRLGHADVYDRLTPKGRKPTLYTMVITQLVSGFWHGIFPGSPLPPIHPRLPDSCQLAVCVYGGQRCRPPVRAASPPG